MTTQKDSARPSWRWAVLGVLAALGLAGCGSVTCDTAGNAQGAAGDCGAHIHFFAARQTFTRA
jgi:hypothetical protein